MDASAEIPPLLLEASWPLAWVRRAFQAPVPCSRLVQACEDMQGGNVSSEFRHVIIELVLGLSDQTRLCEIRVT